jgi:hypothetical protein
VGAVEAAQVSKNLVPRRHVAAMKDHDLVTETFERARDVRPDEAGPAEEQNAHAAILSDHRGATIVTSSSTCAPAVAVIFQQPALGNVSLPVLKPN